MGGGVGFKNRLFGIINFWTALKDDRVSKRKMQFGNSNQT